MIDWRFKSFDQLVVSELHKTYQLRQEVFVVEQKCPYQDADDKDVNSYHLMGYLKGDLVAYLRIVPPGVSYNEVSIGRVVVSKSYRRNRLGVQLMRQGLVCVEHLYGKVPIRISAQEYLKSFYESLQYEYTGKSYLEDNIPHIEMLYKPINTI
jgi:ElaA protein